MNSLDSNAISCKVVLIGESGVGKTSIISRYVKNIFSSNELPTPGASFASKIMYFNEFHKNIKFEVKNKLWKIWDTAGQEKYRSLAKIYYQNCQVAILVYDITRKESFDEIKFFWYNQLKDNIQNKKISTYSNLTSSNSYSC